VLESPVPPRPEPSRTSPAALLERARERWDDPRTRVGALLLAALITGFAWYQLGVHGGPGASAAPPGAASVTTRAAAAAGGPTSGAEGGSTQTSAPAGGFVLVHVAGAVVHPGVVRVRASARVNDAVLAAGGGLPGADLDRLNLAAKVVDGQRIAVGLVGAPAPVESGTGGSTEAGAGEPAGPININTASSTDLEELPGIGPSLAAAIIAEREKRGGFKDVNELQDVRGIGELRFADIKDLVTV
jgi:competence protein ComEA